MRNLIKSFGTSEDGNFAMMAAICMTALFGAVGLSVNLAQLFHTQSNLVHALDAAVTSTARDLTTGTIAEEDARETIEALLQANSTGGFAAGGEFVLSDFRLNKAQKTLTASATTNVDVAFPLFGMAKRHQVSSASAALYSDKTIEVAMMLDVTGSMGWDEYDRPDPELKKINGLKDASKAAVDIFLGMNKAGVDPRVRVALVPYSGAVKAGALANVVYNEGAGLGQKPLPLAQWEKAVADGAPTAPRGCSTERKIDLGGGKFGVDMSDDGPNQATVNSSSSLDSNRNCPDAEVQPLTADRQKLIDTIEAFEPLGSTAGHIGIQWTRYMLSPKWKHVLEEASEGSAPAAYNSKKVAKIAVLMTDGDFNAAYVPGGSSKDYARQMCAEMKKQDIEVFAVGFMLKAAHESTLRNCSSVDSGGVQHFFSASNPEELKEAFETIARNVEQVRLTN